MKACWGISAGSAYKNPFKPIRKQHAHDCVFRLVFLEGVYTTESSMELNSLDVLSVE